MIKFYSVLISRLQTPLEIVSKTSGSTNSLYLINWTTNFFPLYLMTPKIITTNYTLNFLLFSVCCKSFVICSPILTWYVLKVICKLKSLCNVKFVIDCISFCKNTLVNLKWMFETQIEQNDTVAQAISHKIPRMGYYIHKLAKISIKC